jgi:AbrB family looped-hinge helix DNA binding protein
MYTYRAEDIFQDIEGDPENVLMTIPPEICEQLGWKVGDTLIIEATEDQRISIKKVENGQR